ncbi:hypothetical protein BM86_16935, partial [Bacillus thuringiensis]|nr:hypothetical protein [Bacillus thuringiensis]
MPTTTIDVFDAVEI